MENQLPSPSAPHAQWSFFSGARAALAFLTRIPCGKRPLGESALYWASAWFPAVGYFLGFLACLVWVGLQGAGFLVASVVAVAALALVTGGFHEDGLADTADALGGAFEREKIFVILKDSRIGSFGATALVLVLLLRVAALAKLGPMAVGGLLLGQTLSRTTPVWLMAALPYVTPSGTARSSYVVSHVVGGHIAHAVIASAFAASAAALLVVSGFLPVRPVVLSVAVSAVVAVVCGWRFHVRAGGLTGDFLGATQQVTDATILVVLAASL